MRYVFRRPYDLRRPPVTPALIFAASVSEIVIDIAAGTVAVAGGWFALLARLAANIKRFAVSLNDING